MNNGNKFWIGFGDIHEDLSLMSNIPDLARADGVIVSGDITNRGGIRRAEKLLAKISDINPIIYAQIGNMDRAEITSFLEDKRWNIHATGKQIDGDVGIIGLGYATPTPFMIPSEVYEDMLARWLEEGYEQVKHFPKLILVAHDPPYGSKAARLPTGENVGNKPVLEFINRVQPDICLTGHIHEAVSEDYIGKTKVLNPGMLCMGGYVVIRLQNSHLEAEIKYL